MRQNLIMLSVAFLVGVVATLVVNNQRSVEIYPKDTHAFMVKKANKIRECMISREEAEDKIEYSKLSLDLSKILDGATEISDSKAEKIFVLLERYSKHNKTKYDWNEIKENYIKKKITAFDVFLFAGVEGEALDKRIPSNHKHESHLICTDFHDLNNPDYWE